MVYSNRFVMSVLVDGQIQRELANGVVPVKFGSEYSIKCQNKNARRACVQIFIDGDNVSGNGYIIDPHESIEIKRHYDKDRAFKFVSLDSAEAYAAGKDGPNEDKSKGTIECRFFMEKEKKPIPYTPPIKTPAPWTPYNPNPFGKYDFVASGCYNPLDVGYVYTSSKGMSAGPLLSSYNAEPAPAINCCTTLDCSTDYEREEKTSGGIRLPLSDGATVRGDRTGQDFTSDWFDSEGVYTSVRLFLQGYVEKPKQRKLSKDEIIQNQRREIERLHRKMRYN